MNKSDLIKRVVATTGITDDDAEKAIMACVDVIKEAYDKNEKVMITGLGTFAPIVRKRKVALNFRTHEHCVVPERRVMNFKATPTFYARNVADD